jgi:hypothetical protein
MRYRDETGDEIDLIIESGDGTWATIEVKLGLDQIDQAASQLLKIRNNLNTELSGEPAFMVVITAKGSAYKRADGVLVIPISTLGP